MKKYKELAAVVVLVVFLIAVGSAAVISFRTTAEAGMIPIITMPLISFPSISIPPDLITLQNRFREISTGEGNGDFSGTYTGGLDCGMNNILAVGSLNPSDYQIRFFDGRTWSARDVGFRPSGLEWESDYRSYLYASDDDGNSIYVSSDPTARTPSWKKIAGKGTDIGQFINPKGMAASSNGVLYVVDNGNKRIQYYVNGEWSLFSTISTAGSLIDIAIANGETYVTDFDNSCIWHKSKLGQWNKLVDSTYLNYPTYIDSDSEGNLYIVSWVPGDDGNERAIVKYDGSDFSLYVPPGENVGNMGSTFSFSEEICVNHHDRLFYSDNTYDRVIKEKDDKNEIVAVDINGEGLQLMEGWTEADWTVDSEVSDAEITAYPLCPYATIEGIGTHPLEFGPNSFPLTCIPEIGEPREYTINITRELSDNPLLETIMLDSIEIDGFNPNIYAYTGIAFPYDKETVELEAYPQDPNATVSGTGTIGLEPGNNIVVLNVTAQDGVTYQQYVLGMTREEPPASPSPTPTPTPSPSPSASPTPTPTPSPTPEPTPTAIPTPAPTAVTSETPSPTPEPTPSDSGTPLPVPSATPGPSLVPSPSPSPGDGGEPDVGLDDSTGFSGFAKKHPGLMAAGGVVVGGTFIIVTQQLIKKKKKGKRNKPEDK